MKAYIGIIVAGNGTLLGGVKQHLSSYFESERDAEQWLTTCVQTNKQANREIDASYVRQVETYGPIIADSILDTFKR